MYMSKRQTSSSFRAWLAPVPNVLSVLRLVLAVCFPFLPAWWRGPSILLAGLSDVADGFLARRWQLTTKLGGVLDAAADKLFSLSVLATLAWNDVIMLWQVALLLSRDIVVVAISIYIALRRRWRAFGHMPPRPLGKVTTIAVFVYFLILTMLMQYAGYDTIRTVFFILAAACSILAALDYLVQFVTRKDVVEQKIETM